jgi:ketosteroid isomerase-like protein
MDTKPRISMTNLMESRRTFLGGLAILGASAAACPEASAQSDHEINNPDVVSEIEALFSDYDRALRSNDRTTLNGFFLDSPLTVRFGNGENLYGIDEIAAYRASVAQGPNVIREHVVITTVGRDFAVVAARSRPSGGRIGRTMQTWVRFPQGWRIVAAHVSSIDE